MSERREFLKIAATGVGTLSIAGCTAFEDGNGNGNGNGNDNGDGTDSEGPSLPDTIRVGSIVAASGPYAFLGKGVNQGIQMRLDEINNSDDVLPDSEFELLTRDNEFDPSKARQAAEELVLEEDVHVMMGGNTSTMVDAVKAFTKQEDMPTFVGVGVTEKWYGSECSDHFFGTITATPDVYGDLMGSIAVELIDGTSTYFIFEDYQWGYLIRDGFQAGSDKYGLTIQKSKAISLGQDDYTTILDELESMQDQLDFVAPASVATMGAFLRQYSQRDLDLPVMAPNTLPTQLGTLTPEQLDALPPVYTGIVNRDAAVDTPENQEFVQRYQDENEGRTPGYAPLGGYVVGSFMTSAIAQAGSVDAAALKDAASGISLETLGDQFANRECDHRPVPTLYYAKLTGIDEQSAIVEREILGKHTQSEIRERMPACEDTGCSK